MEWLLMELFINLGTDSGNSSLLFLGYMSKTIADPVCVSFISYIDSPNCLMGFHNKC